MWVYETHILKKNTAEVITTPAVLFVRVKLHQYLSRIPASSFVT